MKNRLFFFILFSAVAVLVGSWFIQQHLTDRLEHLRAEKELVEARNVIYADATTCLKSCQARIFQAPLTSINPQMFHHYLATVRSRFGRTSHAFEVLQHGGKYLRIVPLNLPEKSEFRKEYFLRRGMKIPSQLSLSSHLTMLRSKIRQFDKIVSQMFENMPEGSTRLVVSMHFRHQVATLIKEFDAIFQRLYENINELLYRNGMQTAKINGEMDRTLEWLKRIKIMTVLTIVILILFLGVLLFVNLRRMNRRLKERLYRDELTGLQTRHALEERGIGPSESLMLLDVLNFNEINDLYGMRTGDEVLKKLALRLQQEIPRERLFRISGDTFGVLLELKESGPSCRESVEEILYKIENSPYEVQNVMFRLRVCGGVSTGNDALHEAMIALDESKQEGRMLTCYNVYERNYLQKIQNTRMMQRLMLEALERDRIVPFFQPIVNREGRVVSWEALMRINLRGKNVLPDFKAAIHGRIYSRLSRRLIERAFEYIDTYSPLSINLGYEDIQDDELVTFLEEQIRRSGQGEKLTFEILESSAIENYQVIEEFVRRFKDYGVRIAIDDFGSDYSNLLRTLRLSPDYLKIDGTLIRHVGSDTLAEAAIRSIVVYAHNLGIQTVAEYVEDEGIALRCRELGIDLFQGFFFSEPIDPRRIPTPPKRYEFPLAEMRGT